MRRLSFRASPKLAARIRVMAKVWKTTSAWMIRCAVRECRTVVGVATPMELLGYSSPNRVRLPEHLIAHLDALAAEAGVCRSEALRRAVYLKWGSL